MISRSLASASRVAAHLLAVLVGVPAPSAVLQPDENVIRPDQDLIRARVISALGGTARLNAFHSVRARGTMAGVSGFPGSYEMVAAEPNRRWVSWDIRYIRQTTGFDGLAAWQQVASVRELGPGERERVRRDSQFNQLYGLLRSHEPFSVADGECDTESPVVLLHFDPPGNNSITFGVDRRTFLPRCLIRTDQYEEGAVEVKSEFDDYRGVAGLRLPFAIKESRPDNVLAIKIDEYEINPRVPRDLFANPERGHAGEPVQLSLQTMPAHIYKEPNGNWAATGQRFWGMYFYQSESWCFDMLVREEHGRYVRPKRVKIQLYSGNEPIGTEEWSEVALQALQRTPAARFSPQGEIYALRHNMMAPQNAEVDRLVYTLEGTGTDGRDYSASEAIPVTEYRPKTALIFPVKGKFLAIEGHQFYELGHKYERSQQFALDIVALGDDFEFAKHDGERAEDYVGFAAREVLAPAAGTVIYARNDVPDGRVKQDFLKMQDGLQAIAGNVVLIDHGQGEVSLFAHMHQGSVRVKSGDRVQQGQVIGLIGASGSPGFPHLHYQLQTTPEIFGGDGLPLVFKNIERVGWAGSRRDVGDVAASAPKQPPSGVYMQAY